MRFLVLLSLLVPAAAAGFWLGRAREDDPASPRATGRQYVARAGAAVTVPAIGLSCDASHEGGSPNFFCDYGLRGAHQVVFFDNGAHVYRVGYPDVATLFARRKADLPIDVDLAKKDVGPFRLDTTPTLAEAIAVFGPPDRCTLVPVLKYASATWEEEGLNISAGRLSPIPGGREPCDAPEQVFVSRIRLTGKRWHTAEGLAIGDSAEHVGFVYPGARRRPDGWWLVVDLSPDTQFIPIALLRAETRGGKVSAFVVFVGGEGF